MVKAYLLWCTHPHVRDSGSLVDILGSVPCHICTDCGIAVTISLPRSGWRVCKGRLDIVLTAGNFNCGVFVFIFLKTCPSAENVGLAACASSLALRPLGHRRSSLPWLL